MKTNPLYLSDSYLKECDAEILEVQPDGPDKYKVILNQTIFYPMGGGQPTDQGKMSTENTTAEVNNVMNQNGEIIHSVISKEPLASGMKVKCELNWDRRYKNMKVHSAGHIIDFALYLIGYSPKQLKPQKGDHGKKAYIMYEGAVGKDISAELQAKTDELIAKDLEFTTKMASLEELQKEAIYLQPGLPTNKPLRMLTLATIGSVADGGTQVHKTGEVGGINITSVEAIGETTIINYAVA